MSDEHLGKPKGDVSDHQHCDRDPIECSYDALVGEYREAIAERDRLRGLLEAREDERGRLLAERDRLQAVLTQTVNEGEWVMVAPTVHADLLAERDRLRPVAVAAQALLALLDANPIGEYGDAVCEAIDMLDAKLTAALDQRGVMDGSEEEGEGP